MRAYTVTIPNLPIFPSRMVRKFLKEIGKLDGFIGICPQYPNGTILLFKTRNDAIRARNHIKAYEGYDGWVGKNICEVDIPGGEND